MSRAAAWAKAHSDGFPPRQKKRKEAGPDSNAERRRLRDQQIERGVCENKHALNYHLKKHCI